MSSSPSKPQAARGSGIDELYRARRDPMIRLARLITGSTVLAEEIVQEAFLAVFRLRQWPDNPEAYLRTTVTNLCRSHLRRLRVERAAAVTEDLHVWNPDIDETWQALGRLPLRHRGVLVLRFYEDMSESEIAAVLGCRLGTVKSRLHRGLEKLRGELS
ncbi:MAG TPA: SigE family RNA polymerase sigma factor [Acidimicrobiales bacterium]|nr:SigE family RNA polymerase sigma factor [Acidimicrobiales bacterium]